MPAPLAIVWWLCIASLALIPLLILRLGFRASIVWMLFGPMSYMLGMILKGGLHYAGIALGLEHLGQLQQAAVVGAVSAFAELSIAALFLNRRMLKASEVIALGLSIAGFELL